MKWASTIKKKAQPYWRQRPAFQAPSLRFPQSAAVGLGGGMANSPVFSQLLAEVLGCEVNVASTPHTSCLGAAMCGAVAASIHDNLFTAARVMAGRSVCCQPTPATHAEYLDVYERWTTAQDAVDHLSRHLA